MTALIATSVVRGSRQGESHGGVYLIDLDKNRVRTAIDWNTMDINWSGRGLDRGLRGIAFDGDRVFIAASDELFEYNKNLDEVRSFGCRYLKHCHEISVYKRRLFLTSTGFDSILGFDLDSNRFSWGLSIAKDQRGLRATPFQPESKEGPPPSSVFHLNMVLLRFPCHVHQWIAHTRGACIHRQVSEELCSTAGGDSQCHALSGWRAF